MFSSVDEVYGRLAAGRAFVTWLAKEAIGGPGMGPGVAAAAHPVPTPVPVPRPSPSNRTFVGGHPQLNLPSVHPPRPVTWKQMGTAAAIPAAASLLGLSGYAWANPSTPGGQPGGSTRPSGITLGAGGTASLPGQPDAQAIANKLRDAAEKARGNLDAQLPAKVGKPPDSWLGQAWNWTKDTAKEYPQYFWPTVIGAPLLGYGAYRAMRGHGDDDEEDGRHGRYKRGSMLRLLERAQIG